ncbi:flagellar FlbD family protein [Chitinivibrio alkaliphilus]|uniref:Flagellar FlbD family protein n=1 Tax=Chitinivibrio alkaliphilus ACht1 TaxID=1313304 RepID=U7D6D6_9BACT|nr:flagellar FlbD family protein [Chitinivibrio alkaliphilus]ERP32079.1 flagellar FlbD family protein [Chitinivibrio alkaliphilus ACht1]
MIYVTRLKGKEFVVNAAYIETVEKTPDTVIRLTTGKVYVVRETPEEVVDKCVTYFTNCRTELTVRHMTREE